MINIFDELTKEEVKEVTHDTILPVSMKSTHDINPPSHGGGKRLDNRKRYCTYIPKSPMRVRPRRFPNGLAKELDIQPEDSPIEGTADLKQNINPYTGQTNTRPLHNLMPLADLAKIMSRDLSEKMDAGDFLTRFHNKQLLLLVPIPPKELLP